MHFTQNGKIKDAKDFATLQAVAENPNMDWTEERKELFFAQADDIVETNDEACQLATSCTEIQMCNRMLSHFSQKFRIADLEMLKKYLSALMNKKAMKNVIGDMVGPILSKALMGANRQDTGVDGLREKFKMLQDSGYQAQAAIVDAAAEALEIPEDADLDQVGKIAQIGKKLIPESKERMLLEEATTDAALPHLRSISDIPLYAENNLQTNTGALTLVAAYALEKLDYFPNAALLLGMIDGPIEIAPDDIASMLKSTRLAIYEVAEELLSKNGNETTLSQLKHFAEAIEPTKGDGSDTEKLEDIVNALALGMINSTNEAVEMADAYGTKSGTHRFLSAYLANLDGKPFTQNDLDTITGSVKSIGFNGAEVISKLGELAKQHELEFDEHEARNNTGAGMFPGLGAILSAIPGSRSEKCTCVDCQIKRLISEDAKNSYLLVEWESAKVDLQNLGVLHVYGKGQYSATADWERFEKAMEKCGVCDALCDILRKAFLEDGDATLPPEIISALMRDEDGLPSGGITVKVVKKKASADQLRQIFEERLKAGDLATHKFMTDTGFMTLKEMANLNSGTEKGTVDPDLMDVIQEYASKVE